MTDITEQVILQIRNTHYQIPVSVEFIVNMTIKEIEKRIDKVEQDYKNELNDWGKKQPMKEMYPKQMETLERVRKELK